MKNFENDCLLVRPQQNEGIINSFPDRYKTEDLLALDPPVPGMNDVTWKE